MRIERDKLGGYRILLVDDDKVVRDVIMQHLRVLGFKNFLQASNGIEAYNILVETHYQLDLILCDWEMPKADGLSFLKRVRSTYQSAKIPFIMITAQQSQERSKIARAALFKVDDYIVKPFNSEILKKKIFDVLLGRDPEKKGA